MPVPPPRTVLPRSRLPVPPSTTSPEAALSVAVLEMTVLPVAPTGVAEPLPSTMPLPALPTAWLPWSRLSRQPRASRKPWPPLPVAVLPSSTRARQPLWASKPWPSLARNWLRVQAMSGAWSLKAPMRLCRKAELVTAPVAGVPAIPCAATAARPAQATPEVRPSPKPRWEKVAVMAVIELPRARMKARPSSGRGSGPPRPGSQLETVSGWSRLPVSSMAERQPLTDTNR